MHPNPIDTAEHTIRNQGITDSAINPGCHQLFHGLFAPLAWLSAPAAIGISPLGGGGFPGIWAGHRWGGGSFGFT